MIGYIKGQAGDAGDGLWDVANIPGDGGNWGGSYLSIPAASENKEAAYELIQWLTAPEQQVKMWTDCAALPLELGRGRRSRPSPPPRMPYFFGRADR